MLPKDWKLYHGMDTISLSHSWSGLTQFSYSDLKFITAMAVQYGSVVRTDKAIVLKEGQWNAVDLNYIKVDLGLGWKLLTLEQPVQLDETE